MSIFRNRVLWILLCVMLITTVSVSWSMEVSGTVYDENGNKLQSANVITMESFADETIVACSVSQEDGRYSVDLKQSGEVALYVWSFGYNPVRHILNLDDSIEMDFVLSSAASISGTVMDAENRPIPNAKVRIEYVDELNFPIAPRVFAISTSTSANGAYKCESVESLRPFVLVVQHDQYQEYRGTPVLLNQGESALSSPLLVKY